MSDLQADTVVDCRGLMCPMPIVEMAKGIKSIDAGQVLRIDTDSEALQSDVPSWCKTTGHEFIKESVHGDMTSYFIRKAHG